MDAAARALTATFDRLARRARVLAAAEAAGWGAAVAAMSPAAGAIAAILLGVWTSRRTDRASIVRRVDRAAGGSNLFVTADELLRGTLDADAAVRARVLAEADRRWPATEARRAIRTTPAWRAALAAVVSWTVVAAMSTTGDRARELSSRSLSRTRTEPTRSGTLHVSIAIEPPSYTGLSPADVSDPAELRVVEGSTVRIRAAQPLAITHDGDASGPTFVATHTGYVSLNAGEAGQRLIPVVVTPDALPVVRVTVPGRDLVFSDSGPSIGFEVHATDDYGLQSLTLEFTKASGSGEDYTFDAGEIPLTLTRSNAREWSGTATRALASLGVKDGDMLVYRGIASDRKPGDRQSASDAYFIEVSRFGIAAGDAFTIPEQETRYALSEQMLIVKTDRLARQRATLDAAAFNEAALNLAVEQRTIRAEFVFMLGGEIEDEEVEAEQSIELQAGRLANRGQRDLRDATRAMSQAEKLLTGGDPASALAAERTAVSALQRAFARDRYLLRALASRAQLDPTRRLTGNRAGARELRLPLPDAPENRRAARLQDLLQGTGELSRDVAQGRSIDHARAVVLAESALRVDPDSAALRAIAVDLQRGAFDAAVAALADESRRALADPPPHLPSVAPGLQRAMDAARTERR